METALACTTEEQLYVFMYKKTLQMFPAYNDKCLSRPTPSNKLQMKTVPMTQMEEMIEAGI